MKHFLSIILCMVFSQISFAVPDIQAKAGPPNISTEKIQKSSMAVQPTDTAENIAYEISLQLNREAPNIHAPVYKRIKNKIYSSREINLEPNIVKLE